MNKTEQILKIIDEVEYTQRNKYLPPKERHKIMAKEISALFDDMYEGEFVEWLAFKSHGNFSPKIDLHKYWDGTVNEWRSVFRMFDGMAWKDKSIPELRQYWLDNIKK